MYRPSLNNRERSTTLAAVLAVHAALAFAFLNLSGAMPVVDREDLTELISIAVEPPPPEVEIPLEEERAPEKEGAASPRNIESQATPVAAPKPRIPLPVPPPLPVTETPREGSEPTQGAAPVPGPGTGAGGVGTGDGAGGSGSGTGGGGRGGQAAPATIVRKVTGSEYPPQIRSSWPRGGRIYTRVRVEADGSVSQCDVMRSFGNRAADEWTCSLIRSRAVFRPARDDSGRPIAAWFGYIQAAD